MKSPNKSIDLILLNIQGHVHICKKKMLECGFSKPRDTIWDCIHNKTISNILDNTLFKMKKITDNLKGSIKEHIK